MLLLCRGMDYYKSRSSLSGYFLGNWFANLFHSILPLAKKYVVSVAADFPSSTVYVRNLGTDLKESVLKISGLARDPFTSDCNQDKVKKGLKSSRNIALLISL